MRIVITFPIPELNLWPGDAVDLTDGLCARHLSPAEIRTLLMRRDSWRTLPDDERDEDSQGGLGQSRAG